MTERVDFSSFVTRLEDGLLGATVAVEGIHCAGCIGRIERHMAALPGVDSARLNFTTRRLSMRWRENEFAVEQIFPELSRIGFTGHPFMQQLVESEDAKRAAFLLRCLGVAGFSAMNIMLLSVSVWSGGKGDLSPETRDLFHWLTALIAIPTVFYSGRPFFQSAASALSRRNMNMDVPISVGLILTLSMSLSELIRHGEHAYFDSAVMLIFFLLCGRYLDHLTQKRTRSVAATLAALKGDVAHRLSSRNEVVSVPASDLQQGDRILLRAGDKVPADARIISGRAHMDEALVTGETDSRTASAGDMVYAGSINVDGVVTAEVTAAGSATLIDEVERLLEQASASKSAYVRLADRAAQLYAPLVHLAAALTFAGWLLLDATVHDALLAAIAVLIITCPCALALAIPAVQVVASGSLFRGGILLNGGDVLERLATVDTVVFDKTGTLTLPEPRVANLDEIPADLLHVAARLAQSSRHPLAQAIARQIEGEALLDGAVETHGQGVEATINGVEARLGSFDFCRTSEALRDGAGALRSNGNSYSVMALRFGEREAVIKIGQTLRSDAARVVKALGQRGLRLAILSGDRVGAVRPIAEKLGIDDWQSACKPADKIAQIEALKAAGHKVLMVGDGLNDAPALASATVSLSPITASDLTQAQADAVFLGARLAPVLDIVETAAKARSLMIENLVLAVGYNLIAVPLAITGHVTPLVAALAMSGSSLIVTLNALRAQRRNVAQTVPGFSTPLLQTAGEAS